MLQAWSGALSDGGVTCWASIASNGWFCRSTVEEVVLDQVLPSLDGRRWMVVDCGEAHLTLNGLPFQVVCIWDTILVFGEDVLPALPTVTDNLTTATAELASSILHCLLPTSTTTVGLRSSWLVHLLIPLPYLVVKATVLLDSHVFKIMG